eukprot:g37482.t1
MVTVLVHSILILPPSRDRPASLTFLKSCCVPDKHWHSEAALLGDGQSEYVREREGGTDRDLENLLEGQVQRRGNLFPMDCQGRLYYQIPAARTEFTTWE